MRKTLEDFYYGNLTPHERQMETGSNLKRAMDRGQRYMDMIERILTMKFIDRILSIIRLSKNYANAPDSCIIRETGVF